MRLSAAVTLYLALSVTAGWAQTEKRQDDPRAISKSPGLKPSSSKLVPQIESPSPRQYTFGSWEFWTNALIPAGGSLNFDSQIDYSSSDTVRVTLRSDNDALSGLLVAAYWAVPQLPFFNSAEVVTGDKFYFTNVGGATFNTYGSQFRLRITNTGSTPVNLSQVLLFTRVI
jgi:hypothetical protein